jgi:MFS family permease
MRKTSTAARRASEPSWAHSAPARLRGRCCSESLPARGHVGGYSSSYLVGAGLIYGTLALSPPLAFAIIAAVAAGFAFGPVNPIFATVTQENTPPHLLGRTFGALTAIAQAAIPIGALIAGVAVQRAGLIPTIVGMGVVYVAATIAMFFNPALRGMDRRDPDVEAIEAARIAMKDEKTMMASRATDIH